MNKLTALVQKVGTDFLVAISTKDLDKSLYVLPTNREIKEENVKSLLSRIRQVGTQRFPVVFFNERLNRFCLFDGNHLFKAKVINGESSVTCIFMPNIKTEEEAEKSMILLNNTGKPWVLKDYARCGAKSGKIDYQILLQEMERKIQLTTILQAYSQESRSVATSMLKSGNFKIKDKVYGDVILDNISELMEYSQNTRQMGEALIKLMLSTKKYKQHRMIKNLKSVQNNIQFSTKEGELSKQLEIIYAK